jgi:hypothetical protein
MVFSLFENEHRVIPRAFAFHVVVTATKSWTRQIKKPTWRSALRRSTTSAYSLIGLPARPACPSFSHPTDTRAVFRRANLQSHRPANEFSLRRAVGKASRLLLRVCVICFVGHRLSHSGGLLLKNRSLPNRCCINCDQVSRFAARIALVALKGLEFRFTMYRLPHQRELTSRCHPKRR